MNWSAFIIFCLFTVPTGILHAQTYTSKDNYTGLWDSPSTWDNEWPSPVYTIDGLTINIYGKITARDSITFKGSDNSLVVNDTLIINGSLSLSNNSSLIINDGGILLVMGNITLDNQSNITANGYVVVLGSVVKKSSPNQGFFESNDNPVNVFICGNVIPSSISVDVNNYEVLNCTSPVNIVYPNSNCTYGNRADLLASSISGLLQLSLAELNTSYTMLVCIGDAFYLVSTTGKEYLWSGPDTTSTEQIFVFTDAETGMAGDYIIDITAYGNFTDKDTINVEVLEYPIADSGSDQYLEFTFETSMAAKLSETESGFWTLQSGSAVIADTSSPTSLITGLFEGENIFLWTVSNGACEASSEVSIIVNSLFVPSVITPDGDGLNDLFIIGDVEGRVELIIFNRWGNIEYTNKDYSNTWDGKNKKGNELPADTYFYILSFENNIIYKGSILIQR